MQRTPGCQRPGLTRRRDDFHWTVQREVMNAARQQDSEIRERKIWKDSSSTTQYAEPAAGIVLSG